jgi:hypothetical protein
LRKKHSDGGPRRVASVPDYGDDQTLTVPEWTALNGISVHTGYRILAGPNPPVTTQLSKNRIGITRRANREWQAACSRSRSTVA